MSFCLRSLLCGLLWISLAHAKGQPLDMGSTYTLGLSLPSGEISLSGPPNTCYALQSSSDLTNWTTQAILNPAVWPIQASVTVTQQAVFFRSAILSTWSIGGFSEALDLRKDFGATGDGVADDTAAIQAMFDSAQVHSNAVVFVPPGTYRLKQTCTLGTSSEAMQPRLVLVGLDPSKTIFQWAGKGAGPIFQFVGVSPEIAGISIQTPNSQITGIIYTASQ